MVCVLLEAAASKPFLLTRAGVQARDLLKPSERSHCYHHITHVGSHLLANLSHIRNEVTLTHPVSRVFQEPPRQSEVLHLAGLCYFNTFAELSLAKNYLTPGDSCARGTAWLLGMPAERWQRVKTNSSCGFGDL